LADLAAEVLAETLKRIDAGTDTRTPQDASISNYAPKLERDDGRLDWSMDAAALERRIRAYDPWPGTFTTILENGKWKRVKIFPPTEVSSHPLAKGEILLDGGLFVGCGNGALKLMSLQPEGSKRMSAEDYLRGKKPERAE
jgi:methionyl-tRNA formyltransferase